MKILLRDDVEKLGRKGEVVSVADGYARNYLVPRGLAIRATKGIAKQAEAMQRNRAVKEERDVEAARELASRLDATVVTVRARAGDEGKLFGSVTNADIAETLKRDAGIEIDRRSIELDEPIKELGDSEVTARLHPDVQATIRVSVTAE